MSKMKKFLALLVSAIMVLAVAAPAFAADLTIKDTKGVAPDKFTAYQVFAGTLNTVNSKEVLSDITWGTGIKSTALDADGKLEINGTKYTAEEAANALALDKTDAAYLDVEDFIKAIDDEDVLGTGKDATAASEKAAAEFKNLEVGYYFVKNTEDPDNGEAYTKNIIQVLGSKTIDVKTDAPTIEKKIKNAGEADSQYRDFNNVAIGDVVNYRITSKVPDMTHFEQYYYIVDDTLSKGLTLLKDDPGFVVKVGGKTLTEKTDYELTVSEYDEKDGTTFQIVFKNFKKYAKDADIVITYSAKLNENCEVNETGNPNEVKLTYSNNPNKKGEGTDKPKDDDEKDEVCGETPKDFTVTYTTRLAIFKTDENDQPLKDAKFTMVGEKQNSTFSVEGDWVDNTAGNGAWYKLKDGSYTTQVPNEKTKGQYDDVDQTYDFKYTINSETYCQDVRVTVTTDKNGYADLGSLAAGTYYITEVTAPDGYNMLEEPIKIVIECEYDNNNISDTGTEEAEWTVTKTFGGNSEELSVDSSIDATAYLVGIVNKAGSTLPETGGMGTTIFYVCGAMMVLAASVLLVSKKRVVR